MKKLIAILMVISVLIGMTGMLASAEEKTNLLDADHFKTSTGGTWTWNSDGTLTATNKEIGDCGFSTDYYIEPGHEYYIEATACIDDGNVWGILFTDGAEGYKAPLTNWFTESLNVANGAVTMFSVGSVATVTAPGVNSFFGSYAVGTDVTLGLHISADNTFTLYVNGVKGSSVKNVTWSGACIGFFTCVSNVTFKSLTVSDKAPAASAEKALEEKADLLAADVLKYQSAGDAKYTLNNGVLACDNAAVGDAAYWSDVYVAAGEHVYLEMTGNATTGSWGFILSETAQAEGCTATGLVSMANPQGWINTFDLGSAFAVGANMYTNTEAIVGGVDVTIGLEFTEDKTLIVTINDMVHSVRKNVNFNGCYVGLFTCFSDVTVKSMKVFDVKEAVQEDNPSTSDATILSVAMMIPVMVATVVAITKNKKEF